MSSNHIPPSFEKGAKQAAKAISEFDQVLIAAHVNMDGDALGSVAACGYIMKRLGRQFALYSSTGVPRNMNFMHLPGHVHTSLDQLPFAPQSAIFLDCSEAHRLGGELQEVYKSWPSVNIDHHPVDHGLGSVDNYIDSSAASTSQLVAYVALSMGMYLHGSLADSIALGLMTDTGGFCHGNTTADVFALCALLMRNGCGMSNIREQLQNNWCTERLRLWGKMFQRMRLEDDGAIALCWIEQKDLKEFDCGVEDLEGLVEWLRKIRGVRVAAIVREESGDRCKFSLRSYGDTDVRAIAGSLGGGGHHNAAGGTINMDLHDGVEVLIAAIKSYLNAD